MARGLASVLETAVLVLALCTSAEASSASAPNSPSAADLHRLFESRCGRCHEHAGTLAQETLVLEDGRLLSRTAGREIEAFLQRHHVPADPLQAKAIRDFLVRVAEGQGRFRDHCAVCHGRASDFARSRLVVRDGRLQGRFTGHDVRTFLDRHARLAADEAAFFHDLLLWQVAP